MDYKNPPRKSFAEPDWQILGEVEFQVVSSTDPSIRSWLAELLRPLDLNADFINKILKSAQEAISHATLVGTTTALDPIHLLVFAPRGDLSEKQAWGFYRIEKMEKSIKDGRSPDTAIEFYLYLEGK